MPSRQQFDSNEAYNAWYKKYRDKNREKLREYNRKYNKQWRGLFGYEAGERYKKKWPEKKKAHEIVAHAIRCGKLKRGNCKVCNKPNAQAHHEDYSKPLDIMWFCPLHHKHHELGLLTGYPL